MCWFCGARLCPPAAVARASSLAWHVSRSEQLRQLVAQLASLATLEDAVAHGVEALLEVPLERTAPLSAVVHVPRHALPFALALLPPEGRSAWSHGVFCLRLTALPLPTGALAPRPPPQALSSPRARPTRSALPLRRCPAPWLLTPVRLPPSRQVRGVPQSPLRLGDATGTSTHSKRSVCREI